MKTLEYALTATNMSKKVVNKVISPMVNSALSKAGMCRKLSRTVVFSPNKYQGLGLKHPYETQGICKTEAIIDSNNALTKN
jgi:hypothetical protein